MMQKGLTEVLNIYNYFIHGNELFYIVLSNHYIFETFIDGQKKIHPSPIEDDKVDLWELLVIILPNIHKRGPIADHLWAR